MPDASSFIRTNCEFPVEIVFRYVESPKCVVDNRFTQIDFCPLSILSQRGNGTNEAQCLRSMKNFVKLDWKILFTPVFTRCFITNCFISCFIVSLYITKKGLFELKRYFMQQVRKKES